MHEHTATYFATVTAGLERIAWNDIAQRTNASLREIGHRLLLFTHPGPPHRLLALRSVDDVYAFAGQISAVGHTREALGVIQTGAGELKLEPAAALCRAIRLLPNQPSFAITASFVGARNYSRYEIANALAAGVAAQFGWQPVPNTPEQHGPHDLHLRVVLEAERLLVGVRLAEQPLHRRPYKLASRPGSLKAPVAYCMALLAGVAPGVRALDPLCGVGTLALEAAWLAAPTAPLASDLSRAAVQAAQANSEGILPAPQLFVANAGALPLPAASVGAILSNLPFDRQVRVAGELVESYAAMLRECQRLLQRGARAALLTNQGAAMMAATRQVAGVRLVATHQISLFGLHPLIYVLEKQ